MKWMVQCHIKEDNPNILLEIKKFKVEDTYIYILNYMWLLSRHDYFHE